MAKQTFLLTDLEDRALAACDDMYLEVPSAREILESWYARRILPGELRQLYGRLVDLGLLRVYRKRSGRIHAASLTGHRSRDLLVRATTSGRRYLARARHVV
jgi:hypothetical protein